MLVMLSFLLLIGAVLSVGGWLIFRREIADLEADHLQRLNFRKNLLHVAAHAIREPLTSLSGLVATLETASQGGPEEAQELIDRLSLSVRELNGMLGHTLDIFSVSDGVTVFDTESVDLRAMVKALVRRRGKDLLRSGSPVKVACGHLPDLWADMDKGRLEECLSALLDQAIVQSSEGTVRVSLRAEPVSLGTFRLSFAVRDASRGVDQPVADTYFDHTRYKDNPHLAGRPAAVVALNLAARIAQDMGGEMHAESAVGEGTTFFLSCPATVCSPKTAAMDPPSHQPMAECANPSFEKLSVLIVDDNELNLFVLQEFVMPLKFGQVVCASGGEDAVERAQNQAFDVILMDLAMPYVDGFAATRAIRHAGLSTHASIIAVSADREYGGPTALKEAGIDGFVAKPIAKSDLYSEILRAVPMTVQHAPSPDKPSGEDGAKPLRLAVG